MTLNIFLLPIKYIRLLCFVNFFCFGDFFKGRESGDMTDIWTGRLFLENILSDLIHEDAIRERPLMHHIVRCIIMNV